MGEYGVFFLCGWFLGTACWADISLEGLYEGMESHRRAAALRCLGGQSKKGAIVLHQETGSICLESHMEYVDRKLTTREDLHPLFSCKSSAISCSSPKSDTRPPFQLFIFVFSLSKSQCQHEFSKCPLSPVPPHFLTTKLHFLLLTALASYSTQTHTPALELSVLLLSCSVALLPYW